MSRLFSPMIPLIVLLILCLTSSSIQLSSLLTLQHQQFLLNQQNEPVFREIASIVEGLTNNSVPVADAIQRLEQMADDPSTTDQLGIASYNLAIIHKTSKFKQMHWDKYRNYITRATMRGSFYASVELAYMLENGWINDDMHLMNQYLNEDPTLKVDDSVTFHRTVDKNSVAMMYYTSAAMNGHPFAQMVLGYRYLHGISVKRRCPSAAEWYRKAAGSALDTLKHSHIVLSAHEEKIRLSDETAFQKRKQTEDVMDFFKYSADKGVSNSQLVYGYANMYGTRDIPQNGAQAKELFLQALEHGETAACSSLGKMYAFGIGVEQNNETALDYYKKGVDLGDASSMNGLGVLYLKGQGVPQDVERAFYYFNQSASEGVPEAQYNMGLLYLSGDGVVQSHKKAYHFMTLAAQQALPLAQYYLGLMHLHGWGTAKSCSTAVRFFRHVAEKGHNMKPMEIAFDKYYNKKNEEALLLYHQLSSTGDEVAQENAAYLFDKLVGTDALFKNAIARSEGEAKSLAETPDYYARSRALSLYREAAQQGIVEAHVKVGDYFYYGRGTPIDYSQSVHHYRKASQKNNARATFNLGYMHENGLGLSQDYFLAKRYYDMAIAFDEKAKLPATLALLKLYVRWGYQLLRNRALGGVLFNQFSTNGETFGAESTGSKPAPGQSNQRAANDHTRVGHILSLLNALKDPQKVFKLMKESENLSLAVLVVIFVALSLVRRILYERQARANRAQQRQLQEQQEGEVVREGAVH